MHLLVEQDLDRKIPGRSNLVIVKAYKLDLLPKQQRQTSNVSSMQKISSQTLKTRSNFFLKQGVAYIQFKPHNCFYYKHEVSKIEHGTLFFPDLQNLNKKNSSITHLL